MHALKNSKLSITTNMKKVLQAPDCYTDFIINYGAPNKTVSDNIQAYFDGNWTTINQNYCIETPIMRKEKEETRNIGL